MAPYDGLVVEILTGVGASVTQKAPDILTVLDLSQLEIAVELSHTDAQHLKPGQIQFYNTDYNAQSGDLVSSKVVKFGGEKAGALYNNAEIISSGQTGAFRMPDFEPAEFGEMCNREYQEAGGEKYTADDPVYLKGQYAGSDRVQIADQPYVPDTCKEQGFIDFSKESARK